MSQECCESKCCEESKEKCCSKGCCEEESKGKMMMRMADEAWEELMKEKMKQAYEKSIGEKMNKVASVAVEGCIAFWTNKMKEESTCHEFEQKLSKAMM